jgi:hypothetical protein
MLPINLKKPFSLLLLWFISLTFVSCQHKDFEFSNGSIYRTSDTLLLQPQIFYDTLYVSEISFKFTKITENEAIECGYQDVMYNRYLSKYYIDEFRIRFSDKQQDYVYHFRNFHPGDDINTVIIGIAFNNENAPLVDSKKFI